MLYYTNYNNNQFKILKNSNKNINFYIKSIYCFTLYGNCNISVT